MPSNDSNCCFNCCFNDINDGKIGDSENEGEKKKMMIFLKNSNFALLFIFFSLFLFPNFQ